MRPQLGKEKILSAALRLFATNGFHATSISQIAEQAGVSKGLTYVYFKSKDELLLTIIDQASEGMFDIANTMSSQTDYLKTLRQFLDQYLLALNTDKDFLSFQLSLLLQPELKPVVQASLQRRAESLLAITETMFRNAGIERANLTARRFMTELDGIALHHLSVFKDFPLEEMLEQVFLNYKDLQK